jgi:hypothetical protein
MEIIIERGAGLDVHKETVVACIMGTGIKKEIRTFSTVTNDLVRLKKWLEDNQITHLAMESTGGSTGSRYSTYWKTVSQWSWSMHGMSRTYREEKLM